MSFPSVVSPRDQEAFDAARASGALPSPASEWVSELGPERAVLIGLARHLGDLEAVVEDELGVPHVLSLVSVMDEWPTATDPASYPVLALIAQVNTPRDARVGHPVQIGGDDVISPDELWGLWQLGKDVGTAIVHVFAASRPHRDALVSAVEQALFGSLDPLQGLALPLPEDLLPRPFRGVLSLEHRPTAYVALKPGGGPVGDGGAAASGVWRGDVYFHWQAPRFAARPRIADLRTDTTVRVGSPGEEI